MDENSLLEKLENLIDPTFLDRELWLGRRAADAYYSRPEWSYSSMKLILDHGMIMRSPLNVETCRPRQQSYRFGTASVCYAWRRDRFAISTFPDFRSRAARAWRDEQKAASKHIIT